MKGTFKITLDYLKELGACRDGQREFRRAFPDGGEYQEVLDRCADEGRIDFARWLLDKIGPTDDVRVFEERIIDLEKVIVFAGNLEFKFSVSAKAILSGRGIEAGWGIKAGEDRCIFAGTNVGKSSWDIYAVVSAKVYPKNLQSGFWKPNGAA